MGTANIAWPGLPSGTGLSPGLASPCHCYLDNALGSTPPNLLIILVLLMAWPGPCDPSHTYQCAFNAILTPSDLTDSFSPGQILGFLLGEPGKQHLYQITLRLPAHRPGRPALVQFLRPGAMKQKHIPPPPMPGPKMPTSKVLYALPSSPEIPAGGILEFTKSAQFFSSFLLGRDFGRQSGPRGRGDQGSRYGQPLHT